MPPKDPYDHLREFIWLKWLALVLMTGCHLLLAFPELRHWGHFLGSSALPLFAAMIVWHAAAAPARTLPVYLRRLALWSALAQPAYIWIGSRIWPWWSLNIMVSLLAGVVLCSLLQNGRRLAALSIAIALVALDPWLDAGAPIPIAMAAAFLLVRRAQWQFFGVLCLISVAKVLHPTLFAMQAYPWLLSGATLALMCTWVARHIQLPAPKLPSVTFYAWYPLHLAMIAAVLGPYR